VDLAQQVRSAQPAWSGRDVDVQILAAEVVIRSTDKEPVGHERIEGSHQVARWRGSPRRILKGQAAAAGGPPRLDPLYPAPLAEVEIRPLSRYEEVTA